MIIFLNFISFYWYIISCHKPVNLKQPSLIICFCRSKVPCLPWFSGSGSHKASDKLGLIGWTHLFLGFGVLAQAHGLLAEFSSALGHRSLFACWLWSRATPSSKKPLQVPCHMPFFQVSQNSLSQLGSSVEKVQSCFYGLAPN